MSSVNVIALKSSAEEAAINVERAKLSVDVALQALEAARAAVDAARAVKSNLETIFDNAIVAAEQAGLNKKAFRSLVERSVEDMCATGLVTLTPIGSDDIVNVANESDSSNQAPKSTRGRRRKDADDVCRTTTQEAAVSHESNQTLIVDQSDAANPSHVEVMTAHASDSNETLDANEIAEPSDTQEDIVHYDDEPSDTDLFGADFIADGTPEPEDADHGEDVSEDFSNASEQSQEADGNNHLSGHSVEPEPEVEHAAEVPHAESLAQPKVEPSVTVVEPPSQPRTRPAPPAFLGRPRPMAGR